MSGHPYLFAGFNTAPNNGDEVDGAGIATFPAGTLGGTGVSPNWTSTLKQIEVLIVTEEMMSVFDGCADYIVHPLPNVMTFPFASSIVEIGDAYPVWVVPAVMNTVVFPSEVRAVKPNDGSPVHIVPASPSTTTLPRETRSVPIRRNAA